MYESSWRVAWVHWKSLFQGSMWKYETIQILKCRTCLSLFLSLALWKLFATRNCYHGGNYCFLLQCEQGSSYWLSVLSESATAFTPLVILSVYWSFFSWVHLVHRKRRQFSHQILSSHLPGLCSYFLEVVHTLGEWYKPREIKAKVLLSLWLL